MVILDFHQSEHFLKNPSLWSLFGPILYIGEIYFKLVFTFVNLPIMINVDADEADKMSKYFPAKDESTEISIFFFQRASDNVKAVYWN